jgi:FADH2 O2-dependent halogenase
MTTYLSNQFDQFDVAILGSGFAGAILGAILARQGLKVLILDADSHPRFAVGESTITHTSLMLGYMAERFSVPEFKSLTSPPRIREHVTHSCGIKRAFGFIYHRDGEEPDMAEARQASLSDHLRPNENHLFRQDVDVYLLYACIRYGAEVRQKRRVSNVHIDEQGVRLDTEAGESFHARYVVDASGYRSPLARKFNLRETPTRLKTHSRTVFTHMIDVPPFDDCIAPARAGGQPLSELDISWFESTLHHVFDGGWMWVIPFNNMPGATNPLCSVGVCVDSRRFPKPAIPPEQEFKQFVSRYPAVARQFEKAKAAREWVSTDRLQYSSSQTVGYRFCLMAHAAGFIDALFSRGLANTVDVVNAIADPLLQALADDDFAEERFERVERLQQRLLDYNDVLVNNSYIAFANYHLWDAWLRTWILSAATDEVRIAGALKRYSLSGDPSVIRDSDILEFDNSEFKAARQFFRTAGPVLEAVEAGNLSTEGAISRIYTLMNQTDFKLPAFEKLADSFIWAVRNTTMRDLGVSIGVYRRWESERFVNLREGG